MNITQTVSNRISRMKPGKLFSYHDLPEYSEHSVAVIKALSRIAKESGVVIDKLGARLSTYTRHEIEKIESIAIRSYTPKTKALLGFLLSTFVDYNSLDLRKSLNPTTTFKVSISHTCKKNTEYWNLKLA